jgi:hypothetical protein
LRHLIDGLTIQIEQQLSGRYVVGFRIGVQLGSHPRKVGAALGRRESGSRSDSCDGIDCCLGSAARNSVPHGWLLVEELNNGLRKPEMI